ncbi:prephenate dehydratase [Bacillus sp. EB600]|uniref:prephenate dehydratase n=1 Tax=Bacillus sp. EB600 TaxID=2806345 RepID=UPI00210EA6FB|nr:prephenate dehydratase [Bacillus sp. EB600]MCQ6278245.1 prephenate dehydratase [Bacillus sp. EB600]
MKVGYFGPKATFTQMAVSRFFPSLDHLPYRTIPDCIDAVENQEVELAVVPVENALEGSVPITLDYLTREVEIPIIGEITAPIRQHFMVHPDNQEKWKEITKVYSHSHAIAQCHKFLQSHFKEASIESVSSTAGAAVMVKEHPELMIAAIANEQAAKEYGLVIVQKDIHDFAYNHTRFVILSHKNYDLEAVKEGLIGYKTTIMVTLPDDYAGALHQVLSAFAWRKINLSKIESRPMKTGIGNYFFIIDIGMKLDGVLIPGAIEELEALGCGVRLLGSYPSFLIDFN